VCEVTNGRFVEANLEKPALGIGQLRRSLTGGFGSFSDEEACDLTARKLTATLGGQVAANHGQKPSATSRHPIGRKIDTPTTRGGARACRPRCVTLFSMTGSPRIAAMIFSSPPQFGQCSRSTSGVLAAACS
jgi:hypothetical protein